MNYQPVHFFRRVDIRQDVPTPTTGAAPDKALVERDGDHIKDRDGNFIVTRI